MFVDISIRTNLSQSVMRPHTSRNLDGRRSRTLPLTTKQKLLEITMFYQTFVLLAGADQGGVPFPTRGRAVEAKPGWPGGAG